MENGESRHRRRDRNCGEGEEEEEEEEDGAFATRNAVKTIFRLRLNICWRYFTCIRSYVSLWVFGDIETLLKFTSNFGA